MWIGRALASYALVELSWSALIDSVIGRDNTRHALVIGQYAPSRAHLKGSLFTLPVKKIGSLWLHVPSDMKNSIICNDYMIQQQQETLLWNKYQL